MGASKSKPSSKKDSQDRPPLGPGSPQRKPEEPPPPWKFTLFYIAAGLFLLWLWQDMWYVVSVRTIPYSEFKQHLARGEVVECQIRDNVITGKIRLKPQSEKEQPAAEKNAAPSAQGAKQPAEVKQPAGQGSAPGKNPSEGQNPPEGKAAQSKAAQSKAAQSKAAQGQTAQRKAGAAPEQNRAPGRNKAKEPREFLFSTVRMEDPKLVEQLDAAGVKYTRVRTPFLTQMLFGWVLPIALMIGLWMLLVRRIGGPGQAIMNIGRSRAKLVMDPDTGVTMDDVAGCDEAKQELQEVIEFLKNPDRFTQLGAVIPKGVLLVGPPGTGKTLLARAVAGEAGVPFFSISGSDFVEMFVGVGAARVRDLFDQAKKHAPCIVFIDEIDAIGRQRSVGVGVTNDEREQTLNALLVEMDGFEPNTGVIILAATNRPEILDRALLRPGRFDRQVVVDLPDLDGREAILRVHARNKPLAEDVDLHKIALATPGFAGADLANVMNEAALLAARRGSRIITQRDLEEAVEKVIAGPERRSRRLGPEEKQRVAYHETGHALVAAYSPQADPVHKISIIPRGRGALGYTLQLPEEDQFLLTRTELTSRIRSLLGGRAAEEEIYDEVSTGAENDLEKATAMARQMVALFGMSSQVGLMHCGRREGQFLGADGMPVRDCSEQTAALIDREVKELLDRLYAEAREILRTHRDQLELVTQRLLEHEVLDGTVFYQLIGQPVPEALRRTGPVGASQPKSAAASGESR